MIADGKLYNKTGWDEQVNKNCHYFSYCQLFKKDNRLFKVKAKLKGGLHAIVKEKIYGAIKNDRCYGKAPIQFIVFVTWYKREHQKRQIRLQNVSNVKQAVESIPGGALTETVLTPANPNRLKRCLNLETHSNGITSKMCNTEWYWGDRCSEAKTSCCITLLGQLCERWIKIICWNLVGSPVGIQLRQWLPIFVNLLVTNISTVKKRGP